MFLDVVDLIPFMIFLISSPAHSLHLCLRSTLNITSKSWEWDTANGSAVMSEDRAPLMALRHRMHQCHALHLLSVSNQPCGMIHDHIWYFVCSLFSSNWHPPHPSLCTSSSPSSEQASCLCELGVLRRYCSLIGNSKLSLRVREMLFACLLIFVMGCWGVWGSLEVFVCCFGHSHRSF